jgi:peroxiredoxin Q/BCP
LSRFFWHPKPANARKSLRIAMVLKLSLLTFSLAVLMSTTAPGKPLDVNDPAPVLTAVTDTGATIDLGQVYQKNKYTLVYFYPRAGTPGCTAQGCSLRDAYEVLTKSGVTVIGVSTDDSAKQADFKKENHLPFTLIADPEKKVIDAFGVGTRNIPLLGTMAHRQAYLVKGGKIVYADHKGSTKTQADEILAFVKQDSGR